MDRGKVLCAIQINRGFSSDLKKKIPAEIQIIVDGTDSNTATVAMDYAGRIVMKYATEFGAEPVGASCQDTGKHTCVVQP